MKTENPALYGKHVFEAAGLGIGPFKCVGFRQNWFVSGCGTVRKPGGSCAYCGTGILNECVIRDVNGKTFVVGTDCVEKTGDAGLLKSYKTSPEYRKHLRDAKQAKHMKTVDALRALLDAPPPGLAAATRLTWDGKTESVVTFIRRVSGSCGMAGWARYYRLAKSFDKAAAGLQS